MSQSLSAFSFAAAFTVVAAAEIDLLLTLTLLYHPPEHYGKGAGRRNKKCTTCSCLFLDSFLEHVVCGGLKSHAVLTSSKKHGRG